MTLENALALIDAALDPYYFKNLHQDIFRLSWQGKSYQEIAETCGYDTDYVRHVGYQLWQKLSQRLFEKTCLLRRICILGSVCQREIKGCRLLTNLFKQPLKHWNKK